MQMLPQFIAIGEMAKHIEYASEIYMVCLHIPHLAFFPIAINWVVISFNIQLIMYTDFSKS